MDPLFVVAMPISIADGQYVIIDRSYRSTSIVILVPMQDIYNTCIHLLFLLVITTAGLWKSYGSSLVPRLVPAFNVSAACSTEKSGQAWG